MAHITGGGIVDNLPRVLPVGTAARIRRDAWPVPKIFGFLQRHGRVEQAEMDRTFNMGVGMIVVVGAKQVDPMEQHLQSVGERYFRVGRVVEGAGKVVYE